MSDDSAEFSFSPFLHFLFKDAASSFYCKPVAFIRLPLFIRWLPDLLPKARVPHCIPMFHSLSLFPMNARGNKRQSNLIKTPRSVWSNESIAVYSLLMVAAEQVVSVHVCVHHQRYIEAASGYIVRGKHAVMQVSNDDHRSREESDKRKGKKWNSVLSLLCNKAAAASACLFGFVSQSLDTGVRNEGGGSVCIQSRAFRLSTSSPSLN